MVQLKRRIVAILVAVPSRAAVRSLLAAALLVATTVLPALATSGPTSLSDPGASPGDGTTATPITFTVTYRNANGSAPDFVRLTVAGSTVPMQPGVASDSWRKGVRYTVTLPLPVGTWPSQFAASDRDHFSASINGPAVAIVPAPTPTPAPTATPRPTPKPTPEPTPQPTATPRPTATPHPTSAPTPTPAPTATAPANGSPAPSATPDSPGTTTGPDAGGGSGGPGQPSESPTDSPGIAIVVPGGADGGTGPGTTTPGGGAGAPRGDGPGGGAGDDAASLPGGLGGGSSALAALVRVMPTVVVTTGAVTMTMAFLVFGKRRRDQEPTASDAVLGAAAARGSGLVASAGLVPAMIVPNAAAAATALQAAVAVVPDPSDVDAQLPRWRRPSLLEARKTDPLRSVAPSVRLTFEGQACAAVTGLERRRIRYRLVSILSAPDEVRGVEIGVVDEGDEVVLMEKRGTYWRVLCPDGREGWLHKMTLGDVVIDSGNASSDTWTSGDAGPAPGGFEDVLRAYTEKRRLLGES